MAASVSVIIPVYNAEEFLTECLDSVVNQTFKQDYEIICVNDGSTDNSGKILAEYEKKYPGKINVISQENKGLSEARNTAVRQAAGKYTLFADSDDYIAENTLEELYNYAENHNTEVVVFDFLKGIRGEKKCFRQNYAEIRQKYGDKSFNAATSEPFVYRYIAPAAWCKFYLTDLIKDIKFAPEINNEDVPFWAEVFTKAEKINYFPAFFYFYTLPRETGITMEKSEKVFDLFKAFTLTANILRETGYFEKYKNIHYTHFASNLIFISQNIYPELRKTFVEKVKNYKADLDYSEIENGNYFPFEKEHIRLIKFIRENDFKSIENLFKQLKLWR